MKDYNPAFRVMFPVRKRSSNSDAPLQLKSWPINPPTTTASGFGPKAVQTERSSSVISQGKRGQLYMYLFYPRRKILYA